MKKKMNAFFMLLAMIVSITVSGCGGNTDNSGGGTFEQKSSKISLDNKEETDADINESNNQNSNTTTLDAKYLSSLSVSLEKVAENKSLNCDLARIVTNADGTYSLLNSLGENEIGETFDKIDYVYYKDHRTVSYYVLYQYDKIPNCCGLASEDGKLLFPCSAAIIERINDNNNAPTSAVLLVTYATEETTNKNEAMLYSYKKEELFDFHFSPGEGDTLYKGYVLFYDLKRQDFIPNLKKTDNSGYEIVVGDSIYFSQSNLVYSFTGQELGKVTGCFINHFNAGTKQDEYSIANNKVDTYIQVPFYPVFVSRNAHFFGTLTDQQKKIFVDEKGTQINELECDLIDEIDEDYYLLTSYGEDYSDKSYAILNGDGSVILPYTILEGYSGVRSIGYGVFELCFEDETRKILFPDGVIECNISDKNIPKGIFGEYTDTTFSLFPYKNPKTKMDFVNSYAEDITGTGKTRFVFFIEDRTTHKGKICSLLDGSYLSDTEYEQVWALGNYIYAKKSGGSYDVYKYTESGM